MMKKILPMAAMTAGLALSSQVFAGNFTGPGATTLSPATGATQYCQVLSNDVSVQLSKGVSAGYTCGVDSFNAATCHANGTNKSQTVPCTYSITDNTTTPPTYTASDPQCPAYDPNAATQATQVTFDGRIAFQGSSGGGTVGPVNLRGNTCDGATVEALTQ